MYLLYNDKKKKKNHIADITIFEQNYQQVSLHSLKKETIIQNK